MSGALGQLPFPQQMQQDNPLQRYYDQISRLHQVSPTLHAPQGVPAGVNPTPPPAPPPMPVPNQNNTYNASLPPVAQDNAQDGIARMREMARGLNPASPVGTGVADLMQRVQPNAATPTVVPPQAGPAPANALAGTPAASPPAANPLADAAAAPLGSMDRISTRIPTAKGLDYDPHQTQDLKVDMASARAHPDSFATNSGLIKEQPGVNTSRAHTPEALSNKFVAHLKDNIVDLYDRMRAKDPAMAERATHWYEGANKIAGDMSAKYGYSQRQMAGTLAALSPQKDWFQNVDLARRLMDTVTQHGDKPITPEMKAWANNWAAASAKDGGTPKASVDRFKAAVQSIGDKPLSQVTDPYERAVWARAHDEAHRPDRSYPVITPEGEKGATMLTKGGKPQRVTWGSFGEIAKALKVLHEDSVPNISASMGEAHKVRNFYNNIVSPNSTNGDITVDTHAIAGALMRPLGGSTRPVAQGLGTGGNVSSPASTGIRGLYPHYAEAYRQAAAARGVLPRQMQSVTWEGTRGLFSPEQRRDATFTNAIDDIWREHARGKIDAGTARQRIVDAAGGIGSPEWHQS